MNRRAYLLATAGTATVFAIGGYNQITDNTDESQSVEDRMDPPEGRWGFELGTATVLAGVRRAAETPDDTFGHIVAVLGTFPRFGHTGMFRVQMIKACGSVPWFVKEHWP